MIAIASRSLIVLTVFFSSLATLPSPGASDPSAGVPDVRLDTVWRFPGFSWGNCQDRTVGATVTATWTSTIHQPADNIDIAASFEFQGRGSSGQGCSNIMITHKVHCLATEEPSCAPVGELELLPDPDGPSGCPYQVAFQVTDGSAWMTCTATYIDVYIGDLYSSGTLSIAYSNVPSGHIGKYMRGWVVITGEPMGTHAVIDEPVYLDDGFEGNDVSQSAKALRPGISGSYSELLLAKTTSYPNEEDWYYQSRGTFNKIAVTLHTEHDWGNLDVCLYNAGTGLQVACSQTPTDEEVVTHTFPIGSLAPGWKIKVFSPSMPVTNIYDLHVSLSTSPGGGGGGGGKCDCHPLRGGHNTSVPAPGSLRLEIAFTTNNSTPAESAWALFSVDGLDQPSAAMSLVSGNATSGTWRTDVSANTGSVVEFNFRFDLNGDPSFALGPFIRLV